MRVPITLMANRPTRGKKWYVDEIMKTLDHELLTKTNFEALGEAPVLREGLNRMTTFHLWLLYTVLIKISVGRIGY